MVQRDSGASRGQSGACQGRCCRCTIQSMSGVIRNKFIFVLLVAFLLAVSIGGAFVLCTMSPMNHLSEWQQTFVAVMQQTSAVFILLLSVFIAFWYVLEVLLLPTQTGVIASRQRDTGRIFDPL